MVDGPRSAATDAATDALIERIVCASKIADARERESLRRELASHFEDAATRAPATDAARAGIAQFGDYEPVAAALRRAYRRDRRALYVAKVIVSAVVCSGIALVLETLANVQIAPGLIGLSPRYPLAIAVSVAAVLIAVAAWELDIEPMCARLEQNPVRLLTACLALTTAMIATHAFLDVSVEPARVLIGAAVLLAAWTASFVVLARADRVFYRLLGGDA